MRFSITALVILLFSNVPSLYYQWYIIWPWFDAAQHFLSGFFVAMLVWLYFKNHLPDNKLHNFIIVVSVTALVGVMWELSEFIANQILVEPMYRYFGIRGYFMGDLIDTVKDLSLDTLSAMVYFGLYLILNRSNPSSYTPRDK